MSSSVNGPSLSKSDAAGVNVTGSICPVRSMTGYAVVNRSTNAGELTVSLRCVNHRGLDIHFHNAAEFGVFENAVRSLLKQHIARGHVEVRLSLVRAPEADVSAFNRTLLHEYVASFRQICTELGLDSRPDLNTMLMLPKVIESARPAKMFDEDFGRELTTALEACIRDLNDYREREGSELCRGMQREVEAIEEAVTGIEAGRHQALSMLQRRLQERLSELLGQSGISEARLAEEAAVLADRSDVQEELVRLRVHTAELRRMLQAGGEVGKRLDFLLQEMNRETNTILSKTSGAGESALEITNLGLSLKANIERIREQALNLE